MTERIQEEQVDRLIAGETVEFRQEQLLHLLKFAPKAAPLTITKTDDGIFDVFSNRRQKGHAAEHPQRAELTEDYYAAHPQEDAERKFNARFTKESEDAHYRGEHRGTLVLDTCRPCYDSHQDWLDDQQ